MTSVIRVGQSKFVTVQIDEDSNERIMNCIQTLSQLEAQPAVHEIFLTDTKVAYSRMLGAQEVHLFYVQLKSGVLMDSDRNGQQRKRKRKRRKLSLYRLMTS